MKRKVKKIRVTIDIRPDLITRWGVLVVSPAPAQDVKNPELPSRLLACSSVDVQAYCYDFLDLNDRNEDQKYDDAIRITSDDIEVEPIVVAPVPIDKCMYSGNGCTVDDCVPERCSRYKEREQ